MNHWDESVRVTLDLSSHLLMSILQSDNPARGSSKEPCVKVAIAAVLPEVDAI